MRAVHRRRQAKVSRRAEAGFPGIGWSFGNAAGRDPFPSGLLASTKLLKLIRQARRSCSICVAEETVHPLGFRGLLRARGWRRRGGPVLVRLLRFHRRRVEGGTVVGDSAQPGLRHGPPLETSEGTLDRKAPQPFLPEES